MPATGTDRHDLVDVAVIVVILVIAAAAPAAPARHPHCLLAFILRRLPPEILDLLLDHRQSHHQFDASAGITFVNGGPLIKKPSRPWLESASSTAMNGSMSYMIRVWPHCGTWA